MNVKEGKIIFEERFSPDFNLKVFEVHFQLNMKIFKYDSIKSWSTHVLLIFFYWHGTDVYYYIDVIDTWHTRKIINCLMK